jgi:hypothetical protein
LPSDVSLPQQCEPGPLETDFASFWPVGPV